MLLLACLGHEGVLEMNKRKDDESAYYNRYRVQSICAIDQVNRYGSGVNELFRMRVD